MRHHVSSSIGSCLPAEVGFGATTCPVVPGPTFQPRWAPTSHHVSSYTGSCLPGEVGSGAATCLAAPGPAFQSRWAPMLPRALGSRPTGRASKHRMSCGSESYLPARRSPGYHVSYGPLWAVGHRYKEKPSRPPVRLDTRVPNARMHISKTHDIRAIMILQDMRAGNTDHDCKT
jgi:hypothetical protein